MDEKQALRGRGIRLGLERLLEIEAILDIPISVKNPLNELLIEKAKELGADKRTIEDYINDPSKLKNEIKRCLEEMKWGYFFEGMRLLSMPMPDLINSMNFYIPNLTTNPLTQTLAGKRLQLGSVGTCYNKALECFDTGISKRTIRERKADPSLDTKVKNNLKDWPQGTVGLHTVTIKWDRDHGRVSTRAKGDTNVGGRIEIMLLAERKSGKNKSIAFSPLTAGTTDEDKAKDIKKFLDDINSTTKVVRLVMQRNGDGCSPTTMDKDVLQRLLGSMAIVEEDVPTKSFADEITVDSHTAKAFKVKGRFQSEEELFDYLLDLLNKGHRLRKVSSK